jgi:hypothetical protein
MARFGKRQASDIDPPSTTKCMYIEARIATRLVYQALGVRFNCKGRTVSQGWCFAVTHAACVGCPERKGCSGWWAVRAKGLGPWEMGARSWS